MNDSIHEPEFIADAKNAAAYFIILSFVTCGVVFILAGAICPFFWPWFKRISVKMALEDANKGHGTYEENLKENLAGSIILTVVWFLLSWGFLVVAYWNEF